MGKERIDGLEGLKNISISKLVKDYRKKHRLSQEEMGKMFGITGPAIYQFERGDSKPTFGLWVQMANKLGLPTKKMVLLWAKAQVPPRYVGLLHGEQLPEISEEELKERYENLIDYDKMTYIKSIQKLAANDATLPQGLKDFILDNQMWAYYKPTGEELNQLRDIYGKFGDGSKDLFREALGVIRGF